MGETRKRIVLADDDTLLREGIASLLERSDLDVIGQAHDAPGLLAQSASTNRTSPSSTSGCPRTT